MKVVIEIILGIAVLLYVLYTIKRFKIQEKNNGKVKIFGMKPINFLIVLVVVMTLFVFYPIYNLYIK